jgi:hypothetical protein
MKGPKEIAQTHVKNLEQWIQNIPTELTLNLDKVAAQESGYRKTRKVILLHQVQPGKIGYTSLAKERKPIASRPFQ